MRSRMLTSTSINFVYGLVGSDVGNLAKYPFQHTSSVLFLPHIPCLFSIRNNLAPLSRFHQSCANRGEANKVILLVLYKSIATHPRTILVETQPNSLAYNINNYFALADE